MVNKSVKQELNVSNCGLDHDPVETFVRSEWQARTQSHLFLLYRWAAAAVAIASVIVALVQHIERWHFSVGTFFIYLTRWGILLNMTTTVYGAILVTLWDFSDDFKANIATASKMPAKFRVYWALHNIALTISLCITIVYWAILHNDKMPVDAANVLTHAINSVLMLLDILIVSHPMRIYHVVQPMAFGLIYGVFSFLYYICGGVDPMGRHYIYPVLDWEKPGAALVTTAGTFALAFVIHFTLFWVSKLRLLVHRRYFLTHVDLQTNTTSKCTLDSVA